MKMAKSAIISECGLYRYELRRVWDEDKPLAMFVGLNPSTADAELDDPTILQCMHFSQSWGYGGLIMANLYAFRATDPKELKKTDKPFGLGVMQLLIKSRADASICVAAWGSSKNAERSPGWPDLVCKNLLSRGDLYVLALNKDGSPHHPLYLKRDLQPTLWRVHKPFDEMGSVGLQ